MIDDILREYREQVDSKLEQFMIDNDLVGDRDDYKVEIGIDKAVITYKGKAFATMTMPQLIEQTEHKWGFWKMKVIDS